MDENKTLMENPAPSAPQAEAPAAQPEKPTKKRIDHSFLANSKYFTICVYALLTVSLCSVIVYSIVNIETTKANFKFLLSTLSPFFGAILIAFLLNPIVLFLDKQVFTKLFHMKRQALKKFLSIFLAYVVAAGLLAIMILYVFPQIGKSIADLIPVFRRMIDTVIHFLENIENIYPNLDFDWIEQKINDLIPNLISYGTNLITELVPFLYTFSKTVISAAINFLLSIVVSCYLLTDKHLLARNAKRAAYALLPADLVKDWISTTKECLNIFTGFISGKALDSLIIGVLCFILMSIFKMPYALLISVIVGVTNMIPYFGPFIGAIPGILIYLFISPLRAVGFGALIFALQQFDGLYLGPKILGKNTGIKPLWVVFAITVGGAYAGVIGMFLGVPVVASFSHVMEKSLKRRLARKNIPDKFE